MKTKQDKIENFFSELCLDVDVINYIDIDEIDYSDPYQSIYEMIQERGGFEVEIVYYHKAMEYLMENDTSLTESLELASDIGYEAKDINSELLASLLA